MMEIAAASTVKAKPPAQWVPGGLKHQRLRTELLCELRDDQLTESGRRRIEWLVVNEPEARSLYVRSMHLFGELQWISQHDNLQPDAWSRALEACTLVEPPAVVTLSGLEYRETSLDNASGTVKGSNRYFTSSRLLFTAVCGGLTGYFLVVFALVPLSREWFARSLDSSSAVVQSPERDAAHVGKVAATFAPKWSQPTTVESGAVLPPGESYDLTSGRIELTLNRGAQVAIEGPAKWQIESDQRLRLISGRLAAHVPPAAAGFTVSTPTAEFIDVGTEFVVEVRPDRTSQMAVLKGMVELVLLETTPQGPRPAVGNPQKIAAGEAVAVTPAPQGAAVAKPTAYDAAVANQVAVPGKSGLSAANGRPQYVALNLVAPLIGTRSPDKQRPPANLARQFTVEQPITITNLGAFDSGQDGLLREIPVSIYTFSDDVVANPPRLIIQALVATDNSTLLPESAYRFLNTPPQPITLGPGVYLIVGSNYGSPTTEPYTNDYYKMPNGKPFPVPTTDTGDGRVRFGDSYYSPFIESQTYPAHIDPNEMNYFSAASFIFQAADERALKK